MKTTSTADALRPTPNPTADFERQVEENGDVTIVRFLNENALFPTKSPGVRFATSAIRRSTVAIR